MNLEHQTFSALVDALRDEASTGVRDGSLDARIDEARAAYRALAAPEQRELSDLARVLGQLVSGRPADYETWMQGDDDDDLMRWYDEGMAQEVGLSADAAILSTQDVMTSMGFDAYRPGQGEAVQAAMQDRDSMVVMPTGGGKSLCYQVPGLARPGLTVVVSPLIALMRDQWQRLRATGQPAAMLCSGMTEDESRESVTGIASGRARIVFCSPERFAYGSFLRLLQQRQVDLFVVDEAHCLAEWGHDFRPDYLRLPAVIEALGRPPIMAATATATEDVASEIMSRLGLRTPLVIRSGFDRPNIAFDKVVFEGRGTALAKATLIERLLADPAARPAIVYAGRRKDCDELARDLKTRGLRAAPYHAGMDSVVRSTTQDRFMRGEIDVVCATNAFGMGVDKADVRTVIHHAIPTSVEAYYQEAGRAGRDGKPSRAVLLASRADLGRLINFNKSRDVSPADVAAYHARLLKESTGEALVMPPPADDAERVFLALAERAGGVTLSPAGGGHISVDVHPDLDIAAVSAACKIAVNRGWRAYKEVEEYAFGAACMRQQLLDHFSDPQAPAPEGRCCSICDPDPAMPSQAELLAASPGVTRTKKADAPQLQAADTDLYDALVAWRRIAAGEKPAYTVANNAALSGIAAARPTSRDALLNIKGVGPGFIAKHGDDVLAIISRH